MTMYDIFLNFSCKLFFYKYFKQRQTKGTKKQKRVIKDILGEDEELDSDGETKDVEQKEFDEEPSQKSVEEEGSEDEFDYDNLDENSDLDGEEEELEGEDPFDPNLLIGSDDSDINDLDGRWLKNVSLY